MNCITLLLTIFGSQTVLAQSPELTSLLPVGGQRGATVTLNITGKNLQGAAPLLSGHGLKVISATPNPTGDQLALQIEIAKDAPLGPREIRLGTAKGVTASIRLWVDSLPEISEVEPNDDTPQPLPQTPVIVNGRIQAPNDRDTFAFDAKAGETWGFACNAARLRSPLDPVIELRDAGAHLLKMAQSAWETDPRLLYRFEKTGHYTVTVRDTQFQGAPNYLYRLTIGPAPIVTGFLPRGGQVGQSVTLALEGVNLGATRTATVALPTETGLDEAWTTLETANRLALPLPLLISTEPVYSVAESEQVMPLPALPVNMDGAFEHSTRIRFSFQAKPAEHLVFDLLGRRIGSRIDGALRILDGAGKELASNDDAVGKDARLEFTPPTEAKFTIEAWNVEERTGPDCFYRLVVRRSTPDFRLMLNTDRLQVGAGGTAALTVVAERRYGLDGPITLDATKLPPGVVCSGGTIAQGQNSVEITLTAPPNTPLGAAEIHLRGQATVAGNRIEREIVGRDQPMPRSIDPGMFQDASYVAPYRNWDLLPLAVTERTEPFALETVANNITLAAGQKIEIVVRALRKPGSNDPIALELRGLPEKVTEPAAPPIAANQTESRITLTAAPDAPASLHNLILQGKLGAAVQTAPAIAIAVHR